MQYDLLITRVRSIRNLGRVVKEEVGSVAIEMAVIISLLLAVVFSVVQFGLLIYVESSMEKVARQISRDISVGRIRATNGGLAPCSTFSGANAETFACSLLSEVPGDFSVAAFDNSYAIVEVSVTKSSVFIIDIFGMIEKSGTINFTSTAVLEGKKAS